VTAALATVSEGWLAASGLSAHFPTLRVLRWAPVT
jgi:hypothetical protein